MSGTNNLANQGSIILNQLREENPKIKGKGWEKRKKKSKRKEKGEEGEIKTEKKGKKIMKKGEKE